MSASLAALLTVLAQPAPPSDLLTWFEDGTRIPAAFLKSYNRDLLLNNSLKEPAGFKVGAKVKIKASMPGGDEPKELISGEVTSIPNFTRSGRSRAVSRSRSRSWVIGRGGTTPCCA